MRRKLIIPVALAVACALLFLSSQASNARTATIAIKNYSFDPKEITISPGDTVTWTNMDLARHEMDFEEQSSPLLAKGESFSRTFHAPGVYDYHCDQHPSMKGRVVVE